LITRLVVNGHRLRRRRRRRWLRQQARERWEKNGELRITDQAAGSFLLSNDKSSICERFSYLFWCSFLVDRPLKVMSSVQRALDVRRPTFHHLRSLDRRVLEKNYVFESRTTSCHRLTHSQSIYLASVLVTFHISFHIDT